MVSTIPSLVLQVAFRNKFRKGKKSQKHLNAFQWSNNKYNFVEVTDTKLLIQYYIITVRQYCDTVVHFLILFILYLVTISVTVCVTSMEKGIIN